MLATALFDCEAGWLVPVALFVAVAGLQDSLQPQCLLQCPFSLHHSFMHKLATASNDS
jgi:hypothetical protein